IVSPLWGAMSDVSGRRRIFLVASSLGAALLLPLFGLMGTVWQVLGLRFLFSLVAMAFPPVAIAAMSIGSDPERRGRSLSAYHTSRALGFLIGWGGSGILLDAVGFQGTYMVFGAVGLAGAAAAVRVQGIDTPTSITLSEVWREARDRWVPAPSDRILRSAGMHYLFLGIFLRKVAIIGILSLIAVYAVDVLGHSRTLLGIVLALNPLSQLLFLDFFGTVADRRGRRSALLVGFLPTIAFPLMLLHATSPVVFGATYVLLGFCFAAIVQGSTAFIGDVAPDGRQGELMGVRKSAQGLAGVIGPLLAGMTATLYGYGVMLTMTAGLTVAALLVVWTGVGEPLDDPASETSLRRDYLDSLWFRRTTD
ncbi:MAG: MFS transporter, partial [Candidatus Nanohaloarchaea archaeon]